MSKEPEGRVKYVSMSHSETAESGLQFLVVFHDGSCERYPITKKHRAVIAFDVACSLVHER